MSSNRDLARRTRHTLLERVKSGDEAGWEEFYGIYERLVRGAAKHAGLGQADQADVVQETMQHLVEHLPTYDPKRGSFRNFLFRATSWKIQDCLRQRLPVLPDQNDALARLGAFPDSWLQVWEREIEWEWKAFIRRHALETVRQKAPPSQYQIFDLRVVHSRPETEVASFLGVSKVRVRIACALTRRRIRDEIQRLERRLG